MKKKEDKRLAGLNGELFKNDSIVKTLLESLVEGLVVVDARGMIVLVNKQTEELFRYDRSEMVGQPLNILLPQRFEKMHTKHVADYVVTPRMRSMGQELSLFGRRKDGSEFPVAVSLTFLKQSSETYSFALVSDISELKKVQEELQQRNEELDAFAHTFAHDVQSPLSIINSLCELLLDDREDLSVEEENDFLEGIAKNVLRVSNIVNELLLFSKVKKEDVELKPLDMAAIIEEVINRLQYEIKAVDADIILPQDYTGSLGYAPWIEEVLVNYISNALKYGGHPPQIEIGSTIQGDGFVKYWVKDNGKGMTKEELSQIFIKGARLDHPEIEGHGLGLSIVKRIVEKLGGKVAVKSTVGKGTVFSFTLSAQQK